MINQRTVLIALTLNSYCKKSE